MKGRSKSCASNGGGGLDIEKVKESHLPAGSCISRNHEKLEGHCPDKLLSEQHKKQTRRRHQTSRRPHQERMMNMAEARREIATALKLHRASKKQASQKQQQLIVQPEVKSYVSNSSNFPVLTDLYSPYFWPISPIPPPLQESLNLALPNQALGLNLNLEDFRYFDANSSSLSSVYSASSPSTSSSPVLSVPTDSSVGDSGPVSAMDDKEIRSIDDHQHQNIECNDQSMNLDWFKLFKSPAEDQNLDEDGFVNSPFDDVVELFPAWLNANESCCLQQVDDYFQDPTTLPCMDIEEIEGIDEDWLA